MVDAGLERSECIMMTTLLVCPRGLWKYFDKGLLCFLDDDPASAKTAAVTISGQYLPNYRGCGHTEP
jgi:hypothetical protein